MKYEIIATGSKGNAVVVNDEILIDCGVPYKMIEPYATKLKIVLLTHEHSDHFRKSTIAKLHFEHPALRFGCCEWLKSKLENTIQESRLDIYHCGNIFRYADFDISPVQLYHDVPNCGYRIFKSSKKAIYMTDTKTVEGIVAKDYDLYMIEANYEEWELDDRLSRKLEKGQYAYEISAKERHLSEEQANEWIKKNNTNDGEVIYLHRHERR